MNVNRILDKIGSGIACAGGASVFGGANFKLSLFLAILGFCFGLKVG